MIALHRSRSYIIYISTYDINYSYSILPYQLTRDELDLSQQLNSKLHIPFLASAIKAKELMFSLACFFSTFSNHRKESGRPNWSRDVSDKDHQQTSSISSSWYSSSSSLSTWLTYLLIVICEQTQLLSISEGQLYIFNAFLLGFVSSRVEL